jgi:hypothetical protein
MNTQSNKKSIIKLRVTKEEKARIVQRAKNNYLTISDYLRRRGAEDPDVTDNQQIAQADNKEGLSKARFACDHDKEQMRIGYRAYMYTRELLKIVHGEEVYRDVEERAKLRLKEWGYE